jgi:uncharacterized membrane protein YbhN (UPF0104 family)
MGALDELSGWLGDVFDGFAEVEIELLVLAIALQTLQTCLNGVAWRNILQEAYPADVVPYRQVVAAYAGGVGLNAVLPAQAGTIASLGLFRAIVPRSTMAGIVGGAFVHSVFFAVASAGVYVFLFWQRPGSFGIHLAWFDVHWLLTLLIAVAAVLLIVVVARILWRRLRQTWEQARDGAVILTRPRRYLPRVFAPQIGAYAARIGVTATFMAAYDIAVSPSNVVLVMAANSVSGTVALTPGGIGTTQALSVFALQGVASASKAAAFSIGQQVTVTAWNLAFALLALTMAFGRESTRVIWQQTRRRPRAREAEARTDEEAEALAATLAATRRRAPPGGSRNGPGP